MTYPMEQNIDIAEPHQRLLISLDHGLSFLSTTPALSFHHVETKDTMYSFRCILSCLVATRAVATASQQRPLGFNAVDHSKGYQFDPLTHLPGISPYFDATAFGLDHATPLGCNVTVASYLIRHAAIYANDNDYETYIAPFLAKLNSSRADAGASTWTGPLTFLATWQSPITDPDSQLEAITPSGAADATKVGLHLLHHYPALVPTTRKVYADKKARTQDTARALIRGFPQDDVAVHVLSTEREFHSTIPHKYCPAFTKTAGDAEIAATIAYYTRQPLARLQPHAPVELTGDDVVGMQQMCGYESAITGLQSELCDVFTPAEWMGYEYAWDVKYQYMVGHGNPLSKYLGFPWLNVTKTLFSHIDGDTAAAAFDDTNSDANITSNDPTDDGQRFFLSFTHREVPPFLATALGLFASASNASEALPTDSINFARAWRMAELIPFLGHIGIEKLTCDPAVSGAPAEERDYIRIIANQAPRPIPTCQGGPGASCGWSDFKKFVDEGMEEFGDFHKVCGGHDGKGKGKRKGKGKGKGKGRKPKHEGPIVWV